MKPDKRRTIKMTDEVLEHIKSDTLEFESVFGRKPNDEDPVSLVQIQFSTEGLIQSSSKALFEAGLATEAEIYAYNKLGYFISLANKSQASKNELKAWKDAIKEYKQILNGELKLPDWDYKDCLVRLEDENTRVLYLYSLLHWKNSLKEEEINLLAGINIRSYLLFCLTKTIKTFKAAKILLEHKFPEDATILLRSMYENYLQFSYANNQPENFLNELKFKSGLHLKTHKRYKSKIISLEDHSEITLKNNREKASLNKIFQNEDSNLYYYLYDNFSAFTHPDTRSAFSYVAEGVYTHHDTTPISVAVLFMSLINIMTLFEIYKSNLFDDGAKKDIIFCLRKLSDNLLEALDFMDMDRTNNLKYMKLRVEKTLSHCN
ncbi:MAG TPA: DUF5677 domain-containing protein [Bacteroidia bacterium]|jgi:hypothetical protein|nr:DUF5677 domain-containing protein [Bacteroidia bacterium]